MARAIVHHHQATNRPPKGGQQLGQPSQGDPEAAAHVTHAQEILNASCEISMKPEKKTAGPWAAPCANTVEASKCSAQLSLGPQYLAHWGHRACAGDGKLVRGWSYKTLVCKLSARSACFSQGQPGPDCTANTTPSEAKDSTTDASAAVV